MKLKFLGTSAGVACMNRSNSSMLLQNSAGKGLLIDCGEPVSATLVRQDVDLNSIEGLVMTHLHPDHTGGFTQLIQTFQLRRRNAPLTVFMPSEGVEIFTNLLRVVYLYKTILPFELTILPIEPGKTMQTASFTLDFYANEHLAVFRPIAEQEGYPAPCESFSVAVRAENTRAVFSGDIKLPEELIPALQDKTDLLVSELVHFPAETVAALAQETLPGQVVFTHYRNTPEGEPADAEDAALKTIKCPVTFAYDFTEINY